MIDEVKLRYKSCEMDTHAELPVVSPPPIIISKDRFIPFCFGSATHQPAQLCALIFPFFLFLRPSFSHLWISSHVFFCWPISLSPSLHSPQSSWHLPPTEAGKRGRCHALAAWGSPWEVSQGEGAACLTALHLPLRDGTPRPPPQPDLLSR